MFHVKQRVRDKLERYQTLVHSYAPALDLMSNAGLAELGGKVAETALYAVAFGNTNIAGDSLLDVGSGVGLPAVPLAVMLPHLTLYAVERRKRRSAFLKLVAAQLELPNLNVLEGDVRDVQLEPLPFFTAQAVGDFLQIYRLTRHLHAERVVLVSRRGPEWRRELATLEDEIGAPAEVLRDDPLPSRGRLVALELPGGRACRPSE